MKRYNFIQDQNNNLSLPLLAFAVFFDCILIAVSEITALSNNQKPIKLKPGFHIIATVPVIAAIVLIDQKNNLGDQSNQMESMLSASLVTTDIETVLHQQLQSL